MRCLPPIPRPLAGALSAGLLMGCLGMPHPAPAAPAAAAPLRPSVSACSTDASGQIRVYGQNPRERVSLMSAASSLKTAMLEALRQPPRSSHELLPILLLLDPSATFPPTVQWQEISGSPQLCARIPNTTAPEDPSFERFILRLLLTESFLRTAPPETQAPLPTPPRWIIDAIRHRFHHPDLRFGLSSSRPLIDNAQIPPLSELLSRTAADADSSTPQQESQARTLLYWLCSQPASDSGIRKMLGTRWENASSLHTLRSLFPKLGATDSALERGWTLQLASLGTQQERLALDGTQTLRKLDELLELDLITPAGKRVRYPLSLFSEYLRLAGIQSVLLSREIELMILFGRAHPLYREAIRLYAAACHALAEGKSHGASQLLRQAALSAESATVQLQRYRSPAQPPSPEPTTPASPPRALAIRPEPRDAPLPPLTPDITQRDVEETLRAARMGAAKPLPSSPPPAKPETP